MKPRSTPPARAGGRVEGEPDASPDDLHDFNEDQREPEGQEQRIIRAPTVEGTHEEPLHEEPEDTHQEWGADERDPETLGEREQEKAEVRPQHVERAVGEVHHGHEPEDEREPGREQDEDPAEDQAREGLCRQSLQREVGHRRYAYPFSAHVRSSTSSAGILAVMS